MVELGERQRTGGRAGGRTSEEALVAERPSISPLRSLGRWLGRRPNHRRLRRALFHLLFSLQTAGR